MNDKAQKFNVPAKRTRVIFLVITALLLALAVMRQAFSSFGGSGSASSNRQPDYADINRSALTTDSNSQQASADKPKAATTLLSGNPAGGKTNLLDAAVAKLDAGDLDGAIAVLDDLCRRNTTNTQLLGTRVRLGMLRADLAEKADPNFHPRTRFRRSFTQLPSIDRLTWTEIERRTRELAQSSNGKVTRAAVEKLLTNDVRQFMLEEKDFVAGWLLQARLALLLDDMPDGITAAFNLNQLGAWETGNPAVLKTLEQLDERGWWFKHGVETN